MKKILLVMLVGALFFYGCSGTKSESIPVIGEWAAFSDDGNGGNSTIEMAEIEKDGLIAYRFTGLVTDDSYDGYVYGYTGWEVTPDADTLEALKTAKGISFKVIGDGQDYLIKYRISNVTDHAHHEYRFETDPGQEVTVEIPINFFMQPSWGTEVGALSERNMQNVTAISWQTHESWRPGTYDITIWDVKVMQE